MRLDQYIPEQGFEDEGEMLEGFLSWAEAQGLTLYPHQEESVLELFSGNHVVLDTPTGSGKSLVGLALHFKVFAECGRSVYTAPIKALVSEKFFSLCKTFGADNVGMMTGDGAVNRDAPILCCTAEILANLALRGEQALQGVVMDEFHYYADRDRGMAWQVPLLLLTEPIFLLMSATLGDTRTIREDLERATKRPVSLVQSRERPVPLEFEYSERLLPETLERLVSAGKTPVYMVHFTQRAANEQAQGLMSTNHCSKQEKAEIARALRGFKFNSPFGKTIQRTLRHGVGLHHAGLLPRYRMLVEKLAQQGLLKIICGTDTLGVGINVPIRSVLFTQLCKYDGEKVDILRRRDFKQIAGRAGRAGFDTQGTVVAQAPEHVIRNKLLATSAKKKKVKFQPPKRGYKPWSQATFEQLATQPPEALESRFQVSVGLLLSLLQHAQESQGSADSGYERLLDLIERSHSTAAQKVELKRHSAQLLEVLLSSGVLSRDSDLQVDPKLQHDFSLHHSLSLFLVAGLEGLDMEQESYALDVVTLTESILENPRIVLYAQESRDKGQVIRELKAQGVPYEERLEAIEDVTWPQPSAKALYALFEAYEAVSPWVPPDALHPKSVVREMYEQFSSFHDYVKDLSLQHAEGVLLRYLSQVYKALQQNVPRERRTDQLSEILTWLRLMLGRVDSSLVTEWEAMLEGEEQAPQESGRAVDISANKRGFERRVRAEAHLLMRALSKGDWEGAAECVRPGQVALKELLGEFVEQWGVRVDHQARLADKTLISKSGDHQWRVTQVLLARDQGSLVGEYAEEFADQEEGEEAESFSVEMVVDLREGTDPEGVLLEVVGGGQV